MFYYVGTLTEADTPDKGKNDVISTFTLTCSDPHKYLRFAAPVVGTGKLVFNEPLLYPAVPDEINLTFAEACSTPKVNVGDFELRLVGDYAAGDKVRILPKQMEVYLGDDLRLDLHDALSDLENIKVSTGDTFEVTPASTAISVTVREVR